MAIEQILYKLFLENSITTKEELLYSITRYIDHCRESSKDTYTWSEEKTDAVIRLCKELYAKIECSNLPELHNWWSYQYHFTNFELVLEMCHCKEVSYDEDGCISEFSADEIFPLITIQCKMFSVVEFAAHVGVTKDTVLRWIRKGKLRTVKLCHNHWQISELADKPGRKYQPVTYMWSTLSPQLQASFSFLADYTWIHIMPNKTERNSYTLILGAAEANNGTSITLNGRKREQLEAALLSQESVVAEELCSSIMYVPSKLADRESNKLYQKLSDHQIAATADENLEYGPVIVTKGRHKGRIGYYDDDEGGCIVLFGDICLANCYYKINPSALSNTISTRKLLERLTELRKLLSDVKEYSYHYQLLLELEYCNHMLNERYINAVYTRPSSPSKIFISHAHVSKDIEFARVLATDLKSAGYEFFLDEWSIELGENIYHRIGEAIDTSSALIPIVSHSFNKSVACRDEWTSYYNKFSRSRPNSIYPVIIDDSEPPTLLSARRYERISTPVGYDHYLSSLLKALIKHQV